MASLKEQVHKLMPRTFDVVVASSANGNRVSVVLNDRAYGRWNANRGFRLELRNALEEKFRQVTVLAPSRSRPNSRTHDRILAEWLKPDVGKLY